MRISFSLRENIECEKICQGIQMLIQKSMNSLDPSKTLLVIDLIQINQETNDLMQRIEYKHD